MSSIPFPEELGKFSSFHRIFLDFEQKDEVVSYACLLYTVSKVIKSETITPILKSYISQALNRLESWKKEFTNTSYNEIISDESILSNHLSNVANKIFSWAETNDLAQNYTTDVIQSYYLSSIIFIVAGHFSAEEDSNEDDEIKRKFAMQRSVYIKRCLKSNKPISTYDLYCAAFDESLGLATTTATPMVDNNNINQMEEQILIDVGDSRPTNAQPISYSPNTLHLTTDSTKTKSKLQDTVYNNNPPNVFIKSSRSKNEDDPLNDSGIDYHTSQQAQKLVKHAGSALAYDDVDTALDRLYKAVQLIEPFAKRNKKL